MDTSFFVANRRAFASAAGPGLFVFTAYTSQQEHNDVAFPFRQESNFYYLTGITEPDWLLIIDTNIGKEYLVAPDINDIHAVFEGKSSSETITKQTGIQLLRSHNELTELLKYLAGRYNTVSTIGSHPWKRYFNFSQNPAQSRLNQRLGRYFNQVEDCRLILSKQRAIKQPVEIDQIRRAIEVTNGAFIRVRQIFNKLECEHEIEGEITYYFRKQGLTHAYQPIVASGKNACTLHHTADGSRLEKNMPVLIDIGAQSAGYAADITRTLVYGKSSKRQQEVYAQLRQAHEHIIELLRPGLSIKDYHEKVDEHMTSALTTLGLEKEQYRTYFPHAISHGLGLDVHESLGGYETFQAGMVLTVEPGIYIPEEGIGMRIEDDILITPEGNENLSGAISTDFSSSSIISK